MIDRFQRFVYNISVISHLWHKIAAGEMKEYGLGGPYAVYFVTLFRYEAGLTPTELCELCGRDKSDVSRAIARLEEKGLVEKQKPAGTAYRAKLILTPQGKIVAQSVNAKVSEAVKSGGQGLTEEERTTFYEVLDCIASNLQTLCRKGLSRA